MYDIVYSEKAEEDLAKLLRSEPAAFITCRPVIAAQHHVGRYGARCQKGRLRHR